MKVIAINGSPRKGNNTATLLNYALEGARSAGAETELIHLYDLNYKGCTSCFACKIKNGKSYGKCGWQDDLTPIFEKIEQADAIILGSPIYLCDITGQMRAFLERLIFQYLVYTKTNRSLFERRIKIGFLYTMNVNKEQMEARGFQSTLRITEEYLEIIFGHCESMFSFDTYQFGDYSKYVVEIFDEQHKLKRKLQEFPEDCNKAFQLGQSFASQAN